MRTAVAVFGAVLFSFGAFAQASSPADELLKNVPDRGAVTWQGWSLSYHIGNTNMEGLVLKDVEYKDHKVIAKAALPVVRVKYKGKAAHIGSGCGPFPDRFFSNNWLGLVTPALSTRTIKPYPGKPGASNVVSFTRVSDGTEVFGLYVYAEIGGYLLWHGWNFTSSGRLEPIAYSSGWSCRDGIIKNDHRHHPYWQIVFNIDNKPSEFWELRSSKNQTNELKKVTKEANFARVQGEELAFVVGTSTSKRHALVRYGADATLLHDPKDSPWFSFSSIDAGLRQYKASEDRGWNVSAKAELPYLTNGEKLNTRFSVLWLATHMGHQYVPGQDDENHVGWHGIGTSIELVNWE